MPRSVFHDFPSAAGPAPAPRWGHAAAAVGDRMYVFGGVGASVFDDAFCYDAGGRPCLMSSRHFSCLLRTERAHVVAAFEGVVYWSERASARRSATASLAYESEPCQGGAVSPVRARPGSAQQLARGGAGRRQPARGAARDVRRGGGRRGPPRLPVRRAAGPQVHAPHLHSGHRCRPRPFTSWTQVPARDPKSPGHRCRRDLKHSGHRCCPCPFSGNRMEVARQCTTSLQICLSRSCTYQF
jgi:hypothetical protein